MISETSQPLETKEDIVNSYVKRGIDAALARVRQRFEQSTEEKNRLAFHNTVHTQDVVRRTVLILSKIREIAPQLVSEHDIAVGKFAGASHDTVQDWEENRVVEGEFTKITRRRFGGKNEKASVEEAIAFMDEANRESAEQIFNEEDKKIIREAVVATIPGFDPDKKTVVQPYLEDKASLIARAVAMADLGTAGMDGANAFLREGDALFREENLDIPDALKNPGALSDRQKEYFRKRMLEWSSFQAVFAAGRKALLEKELSGIPGEEARAAVRGLFSKFDESIAASKDCADRRNSMSFAELVVDMGYVV